MSEPQIRRMAEDFWRVAGHNEPFPRMLERSIAWALPIAVVKLPHLSVFGLAGWLEQRGIAFPFQTVDRRLRACLIAKNGRGLIFIAGTDPHDEQRFSLAHEVAHFLLDYLEPRRRAGAHLGESAVEVFDGKRSPTIKERLSAILADIELTPFLHLMDRSPQGEMEMADVLERENRASRLALELLAPWDIAITKLREQIHDWSGSSRLEKTKSVLIEIFGLPDQVAERYGRILVASLRSERSFRDWLGDVQRVSNFSDSKGMKK